MSASGIFRLAALTMLVSAGANASESFPAVLERTFDMGCPPPCTLCHTRPSGGSLTSNTPVGISARRAGLGCCDTRELLDVLGTLETNGTDSDMDGLIDVDELRVGSDPNSTAHELGCLPAEEHGCSVASARQEGDWIWGWGGAAMIAALMRLRRRDKEGAPLLTLLSESWRSRSRSARETELHASALAGPTRAAFRLGERTRDPKSPLREAIRSQNPEQDSDF